RPPYGKWDEGWRNREDTFRWRTPLMENEEIVELPVDQRTITRRYTDKAVEWITAHKDQPFFVYLAHSMPHVPLFVPEDVYDPDPQKAYRIVIEHIDAEVGRVVRTVKELGLSGRTYIIFTSDNGPWLRMKHHGGQALPLRGGKGGTYEGGQRVPCVMWGPGRIPAATRTDALTSTLDLLPTLAHLAGTELHPRGPIDGLDISGVIHGSDPSPRRELLYYTSQVEGLRQGDWKIRLRGGREELYHLADDIGERTNLVKKFPEKFASLKARMQELDAQISRQVRSLGEDPP
ncbi:MAG: sulfatase-like hydrolase/transferase, partial [Planctomycetales bacterium]|nr:sulfatase-like hydrolase/transferase [Planctomycetales bacterium]NIM07677.1 sulfatase-like hydrolase/transferase [Planctomycetales bacterium]NIN07180.1 sulfatase-like hydrolase/transferase [Planctomycetales bacterium]NIN76273.1 sulfatase-like hydrolase/transferase [Planctomycetales bacterium]NIO33479.1 sulfatase-like hydrolase/transferase [Planctomycetales bacterium]